MIILLTLFVFPENFLRAVLWENKLSLSGCLSQKIDSLHFCGSLMDPLGIQAASFHNPLTVLKTGNNPICLLYVTWLIHSAVEKEQK